jgi:hypothetical protein
MTAQASAALVPAAPTLDPSRQLEADTRHNVIARRNLLAALWAGRLMGLTEPETSAYAVQVHLADFRVQGDADVVEKLVRDLGERGHPVTPEAVRERLRACHREALTQLSETD